MSTAQVTTKIHRTSVSQTQERLSKAKLGSAT
jgi:hypothetical protein